MVATLLFAAGIAAGNADCTGGTHMYTAVSLAAILAGGTAFIVASRRQGHRSAHLVVLLGAAAYALGWMADKAEWSRKTGQQAAIARCTMHSFAAEVIGDPRIHKRTVAVPVRTQQGWDVMLYIPHTVLDGNLPQNGQRIAFGGRLRPVASDSMRYRLYSGITATAYARRIAFVERVPHSIFMRWRRALMQRIRSSALSDDAKALCQALTVAYRSEIRHDVMRSFRDAGAAHLLALSGMHLGVLVALLYALLGNEVRNRWRDTMIMLCAVWAFVLVAGAPWSLLRAALFLTLVLTANLTRRRVLLTDRIWPSLLAILCISPHALFDAGVQLSFSAMLGIGLLDCSRASLAALPWGVRQVCSLAAMSAVCTVATIPATAGIFGQVALYGAVSNLLLIPLTTLALYGSLAVLAFPHPVLCQAMSHLVAITQHVADLFASLPHAVIVTSL